VLPGPRVLLVPSVLLALWAQLEPVAERLPEVQNPWPRPPS